MNYYAAIQLCLQSEVLETQRILYALVFHQVQAHPGHKINGNKIHDDEKTTRSNVIKTDKVLEDGQPQRHLCGPPARYLPPAANSNKKKAFLN